MILDKLENNEKYFDLNSNLQISILFPEDAHKPGCIYWNLLLLTDRLTGGYGVCGVVAS